MDRLQKKSHRRSRIRKGIRKKISGTSERPRLSVFRSNTQIYAQIINDETGETLVAASSIESELKEEKAPRTQVASKVGNILAERAKSVNINNVVFDRNGFLYHGRVKALAEAAREKGLNF